MDKQQREYIHHLMLQYSDAMVRLTYRRVGDWHLAEDLVQETFLTACCKSERVCGHKKPVAWLFETLNNLTLRESRRFYHTEVSIEDIAAVCGINRSYFGKIFRNSTGRSPQEFLMNYRMVKATELLKLTSLSIADVGSAVGYENQLHFSRAFKNIYGVSPREWRKQNK